MNRTYETGQSLMRRLVQAGIPIPDNCTSFTLRCPADDVATIEITELVTDDVGTEISEVVREYILTQRFANDE